jgi:nucleoside 2-deoxyribosyltransferase
MWFSDDMIRAYNSFISQAIRDSGFRPLIISAKEHNDDICDQIVAEIRKCKFLIADFTGDRGGVYFEAGFAYGLGKEVIYTCREDWFDKEIEEDVEINSDSQKVKGTLLKKRKVHFDLEHRNFIIWKTGDELYQKLKARIGATIVKKQV